MSTETELQHLVSDLKAGGTVHAAFCHEWVEQERQSQLALLDLKLQCSDDVAQVREGCAGAATELAEEHIQRAQQMDQNVWDLALEIRYTCYMHLDSSCLLDTVLLSCIVPKDSTTVEMQAAT